MKRKRSLWMIGALLLLSGCTPTFGPKIERKTTYINQYDSEGRPIVVGTIDENVKVKLRYRTESGDEFVEVKDIGGWDVSPPPLPDPQEKK